MPAMPLENWPSPEPCLPTAEMYSCLELTFKDPAVGGDRKTSMLAVLGSIREGCRFAELGFCCFCVREARAEAFGGAGRGCFEAFMTAFARAAGVRR